MKRATYSLLGLLLVASIFAVWPEPKADEPARDLKRELRVLFIGNSLTFTNDLPAIVGALAEASNQGPFKYRTLAFPNFSLEDHWNQGEAKRVIADDKWDVVVLQQGPSGLEESRRLLIEHTRRFDKEIRASGGKTALLMVWPSQARFADFDRVVESYRLAAGEVKGIILPVGEAWRKAWNRDARLGLYSPDRFHPSVTGSYLGALVVYEKLFGKSPLGLPSKLTLRSKSLSAIDIPQNDARLLQLAAAEANRKD
jgi:hypothetical protein